MTISQLVQFYAPLAGLLAVVFWLGVLSQRVRNLEERINVLRADHDDGHSDHDMLIEMRTKMSLVVDRLDIFDRRMQGVQRQLGNLMIKGGAGFEHGIETHD